MYMKRQNITCKNFAPIIISPERKIRIKFCQSHGKIVYFSIQYLLYYQDKWRKVIRYDTQHGYAHKHIFHLRDKRRDRQEHLGEVEDYNSIYTNSYDEILKNYKQIEENYLR